MSRLRALVTTLSITGMLFAFAGASYAQPKPSPKPKPGLCAPWHRCMAAGILAAAALYVLFALAMYGYQRRGFDKIEHKQGSPDGVPVKPRE